MSTMLYDWETVLRALLWMAGDVCYEIGYGDLNRSA